MLRARSAMNPGRDIDLGRFGLPNRATMQHRKQGTARAGSLEKPIPVTIGFGTSQIMQRRPMDLTNTCSCACGPLSNPVRKLVPWVRVMGTDFLNGDIWSKHQTKRMKHGCQNMILASSNIAYGFLMAQGKIRPDANWQIRGGKYGKGRSHSHR